MPEYRILTPFGEHLSSTLDGVVLIVLQDYLPEIGLQAPRYGRLARELVVWHNELALRMAAGEEVTIFDGEVKIERES